MAIDTKAKRMAMLAFASPVPWQVLFEVDGAIEADDRAQLLGLYGGNPFAVPIEENGWTEGAAISGVWVEGAAISGAWLDENAASGVWVEGSALDGDWTEENAASGNWNEEAPG